MAAVPETQTPPSAPEPEPEPETGQIIEVGGPGGDDDEFDVTDFDGASAASTSVTSSIFHHSYENGRRYHNYRHGRYPIPNDDTEQNREDMKHALMLELTGGKLFFAPIGDSPQKIIDLGCGTGIWPIVAGDQFPSAEVLGLDLSPIQPVWVPPNVRFLVDDIEDEWTHGRDFDLVHMRNMCAVLKDVTTLFGRVIEHTKPGGWIEVQEFAGYILSDDDSLPPDNLLIRFFDEMDKAMAKFGAKWRIVNELGPILEGVGYTNVTCKTIKVPIGTWAKDHTLRLCGLYMQTIVGDLTAAFAAKPLLAIGWKKEEAEVFVAKARQYMKNTGVEHPYINMKFWTGQKPKGKGGEVEA